MKDCTELNKITEVLNQLNIEEAGISSLFCKRKRSIKPFELVMSLMAGLGDKSIDTITALHRYFVSLSDIDVQYKPFHNQLCKPEFVTFIKILVHDAMTKFQQQILGTTGELSQFKKVIVQDGSSFAIHDSLKEEFKGRFTKISPAAVELHVTWDILHSTPEAIQLAPDHESEYNFLPIASSLTGCLFMGDRGYFRLSYLDGINEHGGSFLSRAKTTFNPIVNAGYNALGKPLKRFKNKKLKHLKKYIRRSVIVDMDVSREDKHYRLIASWPSDKEQPTYWITNLKRSQFSAVDITKLYRLRWQIELLFKEWKSWNNLRKFNTGKKEIMEGLIWSSLLSLLLKRSITFSVSKLEKIEVSSFIVAKTTQGWFYQFMEAILAQNRKSIQSIWEKTIKYLGKYAKRASPERDRKTGRSQYCIEPVIS